MLPSPPEGLRHWQPDDAPALRAAWDDPEIARWSPPPAGRDAAAWIAGTEMRWERRLSLDLVIEPPEDERADRRARSTPRNERTDRAVGVAGEVGLSSFTGLDSDDPARAELGIWVAAAHRRRGLATEAVRTVSRWALTDLQLDQLWARTDPANAAAEALFTRAGWDRRGASGGKAIWSFTAALLR